MEQKKKKKKVTVNGCAIIRKNKKYIHEREFFANESLTQAQIPETIWEVRSHAFEGCTGLESPVFNRDGTMLYAYPPKYANAVYRVPDSVPETMQLVSRVRQIHAHETFHAMGVPFLQAVPTALPDGSHLTDPQMEALAQGCAEGEPNAMWDLAQYFETLHSQDGHPFYALASNFWKFFSFLAGDPNGEAWYLDWKRSHPNSRLPAVLDERRSGEDMDGSIFCHLGFPAFQCGVTYDVYPTSNSGITLVRIHPYQGDFWESCNYQTTYLDEYLSPLPIGSIYHMSGQKPDWGAYGPSLYALIRQAISASHKRNAKKRLNNPFFIRFC